MIAELLSRDAVVDIMQHRHALNISQMRLAKLSHVFYQTIALAEARRKRVYTKPVYDKLKAALIAYEAQAQESKA